MKSGEVVEAPFSVEEVEELIKRLREREEQRRANTYMAGLTAEEVATVIAHVIGGGGLWSRRRITEIAMDGHRISQGVARRLREALVETGLLVMRGRDLHEGYKIAPGVETFADALDYLPNFPS